MVPGDESYEKHNLLNLFGVTQRKRRELEGGGLSPLHFVTTRGPYQDGETPLDMRFDSRTIQVSIAERLASSQTYWNRRGKLLDLLRANRSFDVGGEVEPLVYRKWLAGGQIVRGIDLVTTAGSSIVTSDTGRFVDWGLAEGATLYITTPAAVSGQYTVREVQNDYTLRLDHALAASTEDAHYTYRRSWAKRDLYCLLEQGPTFDQGPDAAAFYPHGYREVLRFVAHDPFWYGEQQHEDWGLLEAATNYGDLVFDDAGAWLGASSGAGRWLFLPSGVAGEAATVDVVYWGTAVAKPVIYVTGPATNPSIVNETIGDRIDLAYDIAAGQTVTIDTREATIEDNFGDNLYPFVSGDLATFGLFPSPQAPERRNVISVTFTGASTSSEARLTWRNRYVGI